MRRAAAGGCDHSLFPGRAGWHGPPGPLAEEQSITAAEKTVGHHRPPPPLERGVSLFLDLDGTLVDLIDRPDEVRADADLRDILILLHDRLERRLAIVSGRSLAQLDIILGPAARGLALSGSHGCEYRLEGGTESPPRPVELDLATEEMRRFAERNRGVMLEEKSFGVGLHYRPAPEVEGDARVLAGELSARYGLYLQEGKMMVELRTPGHDKGTAIRHLMTAPPLSAAPPVFVGDDVTDEAGFEAVADLGGHGILVGAPRRSAASFRLDDPRAVRNWLKELTQ